jgi:hypothetical protein
MSFVSTLHRQNYTFFIVSSLLSALCIFVPPQHPFEPTVCVYCEEKLRFNVLEGRRLLTSCENM